MGDADGIVSLGLGMPLRFSAPYEACIRAAPALVSIGIQNLAVDDKMPVAYYEDAVGLYYWPVEHEPSMEDRLDNDIRSHIDSFLAPFFSDSYLPSQLAYIHPKEALRALHSAILRYGHSLATPEFQREVIAGLLDFAT
jgi:hypothetical protein